MTKSLEEAAEHDAGGSYDGGDPEYTARRNCRISGFYCGAQWAIREAPEVKALVEALSAIASKKEFCICGTPELEEEPEEAFRQGSHYAYFEHGQAAESALASYHKSIEGKE